MPRPILNLTVGFLAAEVHVVLGMLFVLGAVALGLPAWYGALGIVVVEVPKEYLFDPWAEGTPKGLPDKLKEGCVDFGWWVVGGGLGFLLLLARAHLG